MNEFKLLPDDPKLTAYALGELDGDERAAVEAALRDNPALGAVVDDIRAMAAELATALAGEAVTPVTTEAVGLPAAGRLGSAVTRGPATSAGLTSAGAAGDPYAKKQTSKLLQFPQVYYLVGGLAAACFAVVAALRPTRPEPVREVKHYVELPLVPLDTDKTAEESTPSADVAAVALPKVNAPATAVAAPAGRNEVTFTMPGKDAAFAVQASGLLEQSKQIAEAKEARALAKTFRPAAHAELAMAGRGAKLPETFLLNTGAGSVAGVGQKKWEYPADEGFVIHAQPKSAATLSMPAAPFATPPVIVGGMFGATVSGSYNGYGGKEGLPSTGAPLAMGAPGGPSTVWGGVSLLTPAPALVSNGYTGLSTLAGTRVRTSLADAGSGMIFGSGQPTGISSAGPNTEAYGYRAENDFLSVAQNPLSTFSADVDTASYANVRRFLTAGKRPPVDAVRIEELLNYFPYKYASPTAKDPVPFAATMEIAEAPWATNHRLVRIGLKGREVSTAERGAANLVFLLDVSGSMNQPNKLPLVKESLHLLLGRLRPDDRVAIVVYAGATGLALPSTPVKHAREIAAAIDELTPGGSTNGAMGIQLAYDIAKANFIEGGINRVVLCTDGDFNVGVTSQGELVRLITEKAKSKVFLTALGFGMGNYKDATLQQIADAGNGNYGYVDTRREAEKLLVEQVNGTLVTIAKDVKLQVEFNPAKVASYRLIGYEKRLLKKEDFNNDQVDAGEIGAGHAVTALYEIVPVGEENAAKGTAGEPPVDELRYVAFASAPMTIRPSRPEVADEWLTLKVRYKEPAGETSKRLEFPLADRGATFAAASADFKFAAAVAGFGMILRDSPHRGAATLADVENWADAGIGADPGGYRAEFVGLVKRARRMD